MDPTPDGISLESRLRTLVDTGLMLAQERGLDAIVKGAVDAGCRLCQASFGVFFYNNVGDDGDTCLLYESSGLEPGALSAFPLPALGNLLNETLADQGVVRCGDLTLDPRYGKHHPFRLLPEKHHPVRSYMGVPVRGRGGESLGLLLFGHHEAYRFEAEVEMLVATVAAQAAVAIENARLATTLSLQIAVADASQELQRLTAERLRQALEAGGLGTFQWDRSSDLLDMDERAASFFRVPPGVPVSRSLLRDRTVNEEDREAIAQKLRESLDSGRAYAAEYRITAPDGELSWLAARGHVTRTAGKITGMVGVVQDITESKLQEASLRQAEKLAATGRLAASIAHEINNPLQSIVDLIYLVKTDPALPPSLQESLNMADAELARVGQLAQHTLGFYRDSSSPIEVDLNTLLSAVVQLYARKLGNKRLQCTLDLEPNLRLYGFAGEMRQVFSNLLVNAIDATTTGTIHLRARSRNLGRHPGVVVLMSDPGSGIPHHVRKRLFNPFFTTKEMVGTGLGLWVTRGMVERHGGKIGFRSRVDAPSGTVFRIHLPQAFLKNASSSAPAGQPIQ